MRRGRPPKQAPEFPQGLDWLNTECSLSLERLRNKIVLLDFWTYGCINSMHLLPDLKRLRVEHADDLVVIGVHSPRFSAEREVTNLRAAVLRHEIDHPVVNDRDMTIWQSFGARAWPTTVLIDPFGRIVDKRSGERVFDVYDAMIRHMIAQYAPSGHIDHTPLKDAIERERAVHGLLSFPAKVLADEASGRLFIADTNHNRIVICSVEGEVLDVAGSGSSGLSDGSFEAATFNQPHGMTLDDRVLYVADTGNHCVRRLDLTGREVVTVAGTGEMAPIFAEGGKGTRDPLNSPWDLRMIGDWLYIAMAGPHQIWRMRVHSGQFEVFIGGGREDLVDGKRMEASLAQPSSLTSDAQRLFFADSQASAIRWSYLPPSSFVGTCIGAGLFEYGDRDGAASAALLQHPRSVAYCAGDLFIADTYNNKIKRLNHRKGRIETLLGTGEPGLSDGDPGQFHEPGGLDCYGDRLFIADTNNHALRVAHLHGGPVTTLSLHPLSRLEPPLSEPCPLRPRQLPEARIGGEGELLVEVDPGPNHALTESEAVSVRVTTRGGGIRLADGSEAADLQQTALPIRVPVIASEGTATIDLRLRFHYHPTGIPGASCFEDIELSVAVTVDPASTDRSTRVCYRLRDRLAGP